MARLSEWFPHLAAICLLLVAGFGIARAGAQPVEDEVRVATASNFAGAMTALVSRFEEATGERVTPLFGSSGKHYAQVVNGAPFELLFAADTLRPALLERGGYAVSGSRFTYAAGKLVLWSSTPDIDVSDGAALRRTDIRHLAIANPTHAPYGAAAQQVLEMLGLWDAYRHRIVQGENVGHAFNFVRSGNAELGFVALSQVSDPDHPAGGSYWIVPQNLYDPIEQQAVLLEDVKVARDFLKFVRSDEALRIIHAHGYDTADAD